MTIALEDRSEAGLRSIFGLLQPVLTPVLALSFGIQLLMLAPAIYMMQVYDRVLVSQNETTLLMLTLLILALYGLMGALESVRSRLLVRMGVSLDNLMRDRVFDAMFGAVLRQSDPLARQAMNDLGNLRQFLTGKGLLALVDVPWTPLFLIFLFLLHPWLGWLATLGCLILVVLALATEAITHPPLTAAGSVAHQANRMVGNQLANVEVVEAMGMLSALRARWADRHRRMIALQSHASDRAGFLVAVSKFSRISLQSLVLGLGALLVIRGESSGGVIIAASILMGRALAPIESLIQTWRGVISARESMLRLRGLLAGKQATEASVSLDPPRGDFHLETAYAVPPGGQTPVLKNLNFRIRAGECLVVVGPSGSGKSCLARLLVGVWAPDKGHVRLDDADVSRWNKAELGPWMGYLPQSVELFDGTVAENIARFGPVDSAQVLLAARRAGIHELILQWPHGYDTQIGPGGNVLSGGQRQRLGLARAMYGDPSVLVLDEPNSNLDDMGEMALLQAINDLKSRAKTVVLITHRRNSVGLADKLLVLRDGSVEVFGPRDAVLEALQEAARKATGTASGSQTGGAQ